MTGNVGFAQSGEVKSGICKITKQERQMWACPSPAPVYDKWVHLVKPEEAREETQLLQLL